MLAYRHVFAFMRKRTLCWKQAESVYAKAQYSIAIRQIPRPLLAAFQMLMTRRCPCLTCTVKIAQVGISEVVYSQGYNMDQEVCLNHHSLVNAANRRQSAAILKAAGVCLRQFSPVSYTISTGLDKEGLHKHSLETASSISKILRPFLRIHP